VRRLQSLCTSNGVGGIRAFRYSAAPWTPDSTELAAPAEIHSTTDVNSIGKTHAIGSAAMPRRDHVEN
jgi:hypothetical protein